ncbi:MAG: hypothetical protein L0956_03740 [Candidatus Mariimomonas ferrooxydans]
MAICERPECDDFFDEIMKTMPATANLYAERYCKGNISRCARHYLFTHKEKIAFGMSNAQKDLLKKLQLNLFPNQMDRVKEIFPYN